VGQPTTRLQVSGYRFMLRRMEHALVRADVRMLDDPLRAQSLALTAGAVLAAVAVAGCAVLALLRPAGRLDSAQIVMERESGALYVRIDDTWHPTPNLASARLAARTAADPQPVSATALADAERGPMVGIPGAPGSIGRALPPGQSTWTLCDGTTTTLWVGEPVAGDRLGDRRDDPDAVLVRSAGGHGTYLLHDGARAAVDLRDTAVVRALRLENVEPQSVSDAVLEAIPESPPLTPPWIPAAGTPGPAPLSRIPVGTVVRLVRASAAGGEVGPESGTESDYFVVLADGVQRVGRITADLIRFTTAQPHREIATVAAEVIAAVPAVDHLRVATFPDRIETRSAPVLCVQWDGADGSPRTSLLLRDSAPDGARVVLAQADGSGPAVDAVGMPGGRYAFVRATGLTGDGGIAGSLFLLTDSGVVFGVHDEEAAQWLGLPADARPAPWPMLARLPRGPELGAQAASVSRDGAPPA